MKVTWIIAVVGLAFAAMAVAQKPPAKEPTMRQVLKELATVQDTTSKLADEVKSLRQRVQDLERNAAVRGGAPAEDDGLTVYEVRGTKRAPGNRNESEEVTIRIRAASPEDAAAKARANGIRVREEFSRNGDLVYPDIRSLGE